MGIRETLSACLQVLADRLNSPAHTRPGDLRQSMKEERESLQRLLSRIQAKLYDAEQEQVKGRRMALWLRELKEVACEIEYVLDEFEYEDLRRQVVEGGSSSWSSTGGDASLVLPLNKVGEPLPSLSLARECAFHHDMAGKIDKIKNRLGEITEDKNALNMFDDMGGMVSQVELKRQVRQTSSFLTVPQVYGRDTVKKEILEFLLGNNCCRPTSTSSSIGPANPLVLAIVGIGGVGKTTLAQFVFSDQKVQEHFHKRIWVHVSEDFDVKRITKEILQHVANNQMEHQNIENLNILQVILQNKLKKHRFLLVLDDVSHEKSRGRNHITWQQLCAPLVYAEEGSSVVLTTRSRKVADDLQSAKMIELKGLSDSDCWLVFKRFAFGHVDSTKHPSLEAIGKQIVEKFKGVPLVATTIGGLLHDDLEDTEWRHVLESDIWELELPEDGILPTLRMSYEHLPPPLKQCFVYCSVFPKGHKFLKKELIQYWMAQGYVPPQGRKCMEDIGSDYLNDLLSRSLIHIYNDKYVIHDLLHELGRSILQYDYCCMDVGEWHKIPCRDHHKHHLLLHYKSSSCIWEPESLYDLKKLHTFLIWFHGKVKFTVPHDFFINLKYLKVLDLGGYSLEFLPDSIGNLKHLRYLDLNGATIKHLPESLCDLFMLQTLRLQGCDQLSILPRGMSNLVSLRYLEAVPNLISGTVGIGKLTCLQELEIFSVSEGSGIRIGDLKDMNQLRCKLCIQNLQRVGSKGEASEAKLNNKQFLSIVEMEWAEDQDAIVGQRNSEQDEEAVLDGLQPPPNLKELVIRRYNGAKIPSWMEHQYVSRLEALCLHECRRLVLPSTLGQLCCLRTLDMTGLPHLKRLPSLPAGLSSLVLQGVGLNVLKGLEELALLQDLVISNIPELKEMSLLPKTLRTLTIENVGLIDLPEFYHVGGVGGDSDDTSPSLSVLKISNCSRLRSLREGLLHHHQLRDLRVLSIKHCEELVYWPDGEGFQCTIGSLQEELSVEGCPKLMALPEGCRLPASLKKLVVKDSPHFASGSLFRQLHNPFSEGIHVEKGYQDLACCSEEALQHMVEVDTLNIQLNSDSKEEGLLPSPVTLLCDRELERQVKIMIRGTRSRSPVRGGGDDAADDDGSVITLLPMCLLGEGYFRQHCWTSSLRHLILHGIPDTASFRQDPSAVATEEEEVEEEENKKEAEEKLLLHPLGLVSLESLRICHGRESMRLPTVTLLHQLTALKELNIQACPNLIWSSLEEGIQSLPSLRSLTILGCPRLWLDVFVLKAILDDLVTKRHSSSSTPSPSQLKSFKAVVCLSSSPAESSSPPPLPPPCPPHPTRQVGKFIVKVESAPPSSSLKPPLLTLPVHPQKITLEFSSYRPAPFSSSPLPMLHHITVDDTTLLRVDNLVLAQFFHKYLSSLRALNIVFSHLTSLTTSEEEGLRTLSPSLQYLKFQECPQLQHLPIDLRGLLPSLKVLQVLECPEIKSLPEVLPSTLEVLLIDDCPALGEWNWQWVAGHVPVIGIRRDIVQGSYSICQNLKDKWDF